MPTRERADAEQALLRAIGHEVGKHIHDQVVASFESKLRAADSRVSKAVAAKAATEENLRKAQATRDRAQDKLHLAIREMREQGEENARLREALHQALFLVAQLKNPAEPVLTVEDWLKLPERQFPLPKRLADGTGSGEPKEDE